MNLLSTPIANVISGLVTVR